MLKNDQKGGTICLDKNEHKISNDKKFLNEGDEKMEMCSQGAYKTLDFGKLKFAGKCITTKESLSDIIPIDWAAKDSDQKRDVSILEDHKERIDWVMCKKGDIILIQSYKDEGVTLPRHSFVVLDDTGGTVRGMDFDFISSVMSSFQSEEHRIKKLKYDENVEITPADTQMCPGHNSKSGYIKSDQFYYFKKEKINYVVIGQMTTVAFNALLAIIEKLSEIRQIVDNL